MLVKRRRGSGASLIKVGYLTLISPPFNSCGEELGSVLGCGETGVYGMLIPKVSVDDLPVVPLS